MTRPALYVAAPFGDPSPTIRAWHTARAALLCRLATLSGFAPICPHPTIAAGGYGDDSDPAQRAAGMEATLALALLVARARGTLWALSRDDGTLSAGTDAELDAWPPSLDPPRAYTWTEWAIKVAAKAPALLPEWDALAVRPDHVGEPCAWYKSHTGQRRAYPSGGTAAHVDRGGWAAYLPGEIKPFDQGPEVKSAGRAAADAALRAAGVLK